MKILHLNLSLPDHRVEKAAYLAKKGGHTCYYVGGIEKSYEPAPLFGEDIFEEYFEITFSPKNVVGLNLTPHIKFLNKIKEKINFDVIHAHNVYCAHLADKMNCPVVFDDHEFYSIELKYMKTSLKDFKDYISKIMMRLKYPRWEKRLSKKYPIISVSNRILEDYKKRNPKTNTFLVPNAPLLLEIENLPDLERYDDELVSIYTGLNDFPTDVPHRNTTGLLDLWRNNDIGRFLILGDRRLKSSGKIKSLGFVSQKRLFKELLKSHVGIFGFLPHPYHYYGGSNKIFNYLLCGLFFVYPKALTLASEICNQISRELDINFGFEYETFKEIEEFLLKNKERLKNFDHKQISEYAKKNLVLDSYQSNLLEAYRTAVSNYKS